MPRRLKLAVLAALLPAAAAAAQPPAIPAEYRPIARAPSAGRLVVAGLHGRDIAVDVAGYELGEFALLGNGRYFGFARSAHEDYGYLLVDRAADGAAAVMDTGHQPVFSSDGRYFAAAEMSEAVFGNLNGLAVWEVRPGRTARRLFTDAVPRAFDWRVDGWPRPDCVAISAIDLAWQPPEGVDYETGLRAAPRSQYQVELRDDAVTLTASIASAACGVEPAE